MQRWMNAVGLAGVAMLIVGLAQLFSGSGHRANWMYWVGGPVLWFMGFALVVGWLLFRCLSPGASDGKPMHK